jgi:hypothetical protein
VRIHFLRKYEESQEEERESRVLQREGEQWVDGSEMNRGIA